MADGTPDDAALHVTAPFAARHDAIADQEGSGADVVGNHLERIVLQIGAAGLARSSRNQCLEQIDLVIAVFVLQDGCQALQSHAGIDAGRRQRLDRTIGLHVELHEHVVPDLDVAVAIGIRRAGRATGHIGAVVVENLAARTARSRISHHPEVVGCILRTLVVADTHHALGWQADLLGPDVVGLVIVDVDRGPQLVGRQLVDLGQQFPGPGQALALEVVAKTPVAQHLEERMVARGITDVFQVVVFAARTQAGLHRGRTHVRALVGAQKHVLELHHARVDEHQRRIIARHQRARRHHGVTLGGEEIQEYLADVGNGSGDGGHGCGAGGRCRTHATNVARCQSGRVGRPMDFTCTGLALTLRGQAPGKGRTDAHR